MICIKCLHTKTKVINSRQHTQQPKTWRRRRCPHCQTIFTTYELPTLETYLVKDQHGTQRPFRLGKIALSIAKSFQHDQQAAAYDSYELAQTIQTYLVVHYHQPTPADISQATHTVLQRYDPVAALQYAARHGLVTSRRRGRPSTSYPLSGDHSSRPSSSR